MTKRPMLAAVLLAMTLSTLGQNAGAQEPDPPGVDNILDAYCTVEFITVTHDLLKKLDLVGKDLGAYSLETVKMFHDDAAHAGYTL